MALKVLHTYFHVFAHRKNENISQKLKKKNKNIPWLYFFSKQQGALKLSFGICGKMFLLEAYRGVAVCGIYQSCKMKTNIT